MRIKSASAVRTGTSHLQAGKPCQDSACCRGGREAVCAVLAEGAGSRPDSQLASAAVTAAVAAELSENFSRWYAMEDAELIRGMLSLCRGSVAAAAPGTEAACTLLAVALSPDGRSLACHIGDGAVLGAGPGVRAVLSPPENGSEPWYTFFVSGRRAEEHLRVRRDLPPAYRTVILCSDGAGAALFNARGDIANAVEVLDAWMDALDGEEVSQRLEAELDERFRERTRDDMSLAVLHRTDE